MKKTLEFYQKYLYPVFVTIVVIMFISLLVVADANTVVAGTPLASNVETATNDSMKVIIGIMGSFLIFILTASEATRRSTQKEKNTLIKETIDKVDKVTEIQIKTQENLNALIELCRPMFALVTKHETQLTELKTLHEYNHDQHIQG